MEIPIDSDLQNPSPIENIPNTVTVPNPNKNYFKPLFFLFFGLFLITIITSVYLLAKTNEPTSTPEPVNQIAETITPTANWQTYANSDYNFSFQYPNGYEIKNDIKTASELDISVRKINDSQEAENNDGVCSDCTFRIQVLKNFIGGNANGSFKTPEEWITFQNKIGQNYSQTTLNNKIAYFISDPKTNKENYLIYIKNGDMFDRFDLNIRTNDKVSQNIISSFKFN